MGKGHAEFLSDEWISELRDIIIEYDDPDDFKMEFRGGTWWNILNVLSLVPANERAQHVSDRWDEIAKVKGTWIWS